MARRKAEEPVTVNRRRMPPARTTQEREDQLVALTYDLVEQRIRNGTATSQETTHFLRLGSERERLERRRLESAIAWEQKKIDNLNASERSEELFKQAINVFKEYRGEEVIEQ